MINLSSVNRLYRYTQLEVNTANTRYLTQFLYSSSRNIQKFLGRDFEQNTYTEYFRVEPRIQQFWVLGIPVSSITSVDNDSDGLFDGSETALTDFYTGPSDRSVVIDDFINPGAKSLKIVYVGGVATQATKSTFTIDMGVGSFVAGKFVTDSVTGATGIVVSFVSDTSMVIDNLSGVFAVGSTLTMQDTEGGDDSGPTTQITSITSQSFVEQFPDIAMACEMQTRFDMQHKFTFELTEINKEKTVRLKPSDSFEPSMINTYMGIRPEVRNLLRPYRRSDFG